MIGRESFNYPEKTKACMSRIKKSLFPPISLYLFLVKKTVEIVSLFLIDYFWSLRGTGNRES